MSQENVEAFKRAVDASDRLDVEALLSELDPEVEWHSAIWMALGGERTVYRGHEGIREFFRDISETLSELQSEYSETRDAGDLIVAIGRIRTRGTVSGAETESPIGSVVEFKNGRAIRIRTFLDHKEALEAAGLRE